MRAAATVLQHHETNRQSNGGSFHPNAHSVLGSKSGKSVAIVVCTTEASSIYRPRPPRLSPLYQLIERYFPEFERTYDLRYQQRYGP